MTLTIKLTLRKSPGIPTPTPSQPTALSSGAIRDESIFGERGGRRGVGGLWRPSPTTNELQKIQLRSTSNYSENLV